MTPCGVVPLICGLANYYLLTLPIAVVSSWILIVLHCGCCCIQAAKCTCLVYLTVSQDGHTLYPNICYPWNMLNYTRPFEWNVLNHSSGFDLWYVTCCETYVLTQMQSYTCRWFARKAGSNDMAIYNILISNFRPNERCPVCYKCKIKGTINAAFYLASLHL